MSDVQCKKNRNEVIPVSEAVANHFEDYNSCISCQDFDKCREEKEQAEIEGHGVMREQSTIIEIDQAFTEALQCDADILSCVATKHRLTELRNGRTTWIGRDENLLRFKIDAFLN